MSNHESKIRYESVHILMGLSRDSNRCVRIIDYGRGGEIEILTLKLNIIGGHWRIHKTVNARDVGKAAKILMHRLIDLPEQAQYMETLWKTALLQKECIFGEKKFMLDVDTEDIDKIIKIERMIPKGIDIIRNKSPKGWHFIVKPFDTREMSLLPYVTLIRDGYYYIKTVGGGK